MSDYETIKKINILADEINRINKNEELFHNSFKLMKSMIDNIHERLEKLEGGSK